MCGTAAGIAKIGEREEGVDARFDVALVQRVDEQRRRATVAERAEDHREIAANARIVMFRSVVERRNLLLEIDDLLPLAALERLRELIRRLPALMRAAGLDLVQVIGNRLLIAGELPEEEKDRDSNHDDAEGKDDEL